MLRRESNSGADLQNTDYGFSVVAYPYLFNLFDRFTKCRQTISSGVKSAASNVLYPSASSLEAHWLGYLGDGILKFYYAYVLSFPE